jgi:hypothetical protein
MFSSMGSPGLGTVHREGKRQRLIPMDAIAMLKIQMVLSLQSVF